MRPDGHAEALRQPVRAQAARLELAPEQPSRWAIGGIALSRVIMPSACAPSL
jgi:hypothetical protein